MASMLCGAVAIFLGSSCATTTAARTGTTIYLGAVSPGTDEVHEGVRSWTAMKFDNLVHQRTDFSCGAAVLATIFNYGFGHHTTEQQVLVNMLKVADPDIVRDKGFSLLDMKNYAKAVGLVGEGFKVDYAAVGQLKVPAIALLNIRGYKHFVIVRKADAERVSIGDPALGNRVMSRPEFERAWNQVLFVIIGKGFDPKTVLLNPPQPLSAKRLYDQRSPIVNAEASEFGFGAGFNFAVWQGRP